MRIAIAVPPVGARQVKINVQSESLTFQVVSSAGLILGVSCNGYLASNDAILSQSSLGTPSSNWNI